jgi:hypothetical protein
MKALFAALCIGLALVPLPGCTTASGTQEAQDRQQAPAHSPFPYPYNSRY